MAESRITRWECDRCGITTEVTLGEQPKGWVGLIVCPKPNYNANDGVSMRYHLCEICRDDLHVLLYGVEDVDVAWTRLGADDA